MSDSLNANAIISLADANLWIFGDANETTDNGLVRDLINEASTQIETRLRRKVIGQSITETFDGNGDATFLTRYYPVISLTSISIEDESSPDVGETDEVRVDLEKGKIYLLQTFFSSGNPQNCEIVYTAGFAADIDALLADEVGSLIAQVCRELVKRAYKLRDRQAEDVESISAEGQTVKYLVDRAWNRETWGKIAFLSVPRAGRRR